MKAQLKTASTQDQIKTMQYFLHKFILTSFLIFQRNFIGKALPHLETRCRHENQNVFLVDNLLQQDEIEWFNGYLPRHRPWVLNQKDLSKESSIQMSSNATWVSPMSTEMFERTRVWKELSSILKQLTGSEQFMCSAIFTLTYRLDFKPTAKSGKSECILCSDVRLSITFWSSMHGENNK